MNVVSQLIFNTLTFAIAGTGCLVIGAIVLNNPPLTESPGLVRRLATYLMNNVAETRRQHTFPELELPCYRIAPERLLSSIEHATDLLGWDIIDLNAPKHRLKAVVTTPLFKFKDDVEIRLTLAADDSGTEVHIRSSSRVGRADFGANTRHILDLLATLERQA